ncbi:hypothetical protein K525DRAFT_274221 [Schizophyllum commune Loenen D]|nr:hypothetical protein K525DRAFT_274221 [Schizophyllum commune Loenen D]
MATSKYGVRGVALTVGPGLSSSPISATVKGATNSWRTTSTQLARTSSHSTVTACCPIRCAPARPPTAPSPTTWTTDDSDWGSDIDERLEGLDNSVGAGGTARCEVWRLLRRSSPSEDAIGPNFGTSSDYDARSRLRLRLRHGEYERNLTSQWPAIRWGPSVLRALGLDVSCVGLHAPRRE